MLRRNVGIQRTLVHEDETLRRNVRIQRNYKFLTMRTVGGIETSGSRRNYRPTIKESKKLKE